MGDPLKHLKKYQTGGTGDVMHLAFPLPRSASGLVERHCPSEACAPRIFQLGDGPGAAQQLAPSAAARIRRGPGGDGTACPYCGTMADDAAFLSPLAREAARQLAIDAARAAGPVTTPTSVGPSEWDKNRAAKRERRAAPHVKHRGGERRRRPTYPAKPCAQCGAQFVPSGPNTRACAACSPRRKRPRQ